MQEDNMNMNGVSQHIKKESNETRTDTEANEVLKSNETTVLDVYNNIKSEPRTKDYEQSNNDPDSSYLHYGSDRSAMLFGAEALRLNVDTEDVQTHDESNNEETQSLLVDKGNDENGEHDQMIIDTNRNDPQKSTGKRKKKA